jgi:hypothetical protein
MAYSRKSLDKISTCKLLLRLFAVKLMEKVGKVNHPLLTDVTVVYGLRGKSDQDEAVAEGNSQKPWPTSKHNNSLLPVIPTDLSTISEDQKSDAIDLAPCPLDWDALEKDPTPWMILGYLGQRVIAENEWGGKIRWGGTAWPHFVDEPHFELI